MVVGFASVRQSLASVLERKTFLGEFADRFGRYVQSGGKDETLYVEMTQRVVRMQRELGSHGVLGMFRPPFANFAYQDYPILVNLLPEYRQSANDWVLRDQAAQYANMIRDTLIRYSGILDDREIDSRHKLKNPLIWLREGVRVVVATPFKLLRSFGILSPVTELGITTSRLIRVGSGILALVTLIAALVQIITGWDATIRFISGASG